MLLDERAESLQAALIECGDLATTLWPGFDGAGRAAELEQPGDGRDVDREAMRELASRSLAVVDGGDDPLSEIVGKGSHGSPPGGDITSESCAKWT